MKTLARRINRLESRRFTTPETALMSDDAHSGLWIAIRRATGDDPRYNRVQLLRSERLAIGDVDYCRRMLERQDRRDLSKLAKIDLENHENRETHEVSFKLLQVMERQPIVARLCALYGFDEREAEDRITRAQAAAEAQGLEGLSMSELIFEAFQLEEN